MAAIAALLVNFGSSVTAPILLIRTFVHRRRHGLLFRFQGFRAAPTPGPRLFRWIAWRWLAFGFLFTGFVLAFAVSYLIAGEPIYYVNEKRNLTDAEAWDMILMFLSGGGFFFIAGLLGVLFLPKN